MTSVAIAIIPTRIWKIGIVVGMICTDRCHVITVDQDQEADSFSFDPAFMYLCSYCQQGRWQQLNFTKFHEIIWGYFWAAFLSIFSCVLRMDNNKSNIDLFRLHNTKSKFSYYWNRYKFQMQFPMAKQNLIKISFFINLFHLLA